MRNVTRGNDNLSEGSIDFTKQKNKTASSKKGTGSGTFPRRGKIQEDLL